MSASASASASASRPGPGPSPQDASASPSSVAQFGEDLLVWEFFGRRSDGFFVEVGASDPVRYSQTWWLEQQGWRGLLVEPLSARVAALRAQRPRSRVWAVAVGAPEQRGQTELHVTSDDMFSSLLARAQGPGERARETVRVLTLDEVLTEAGETRADFVSIDVEGMELDVLRGFSLERVRPRLLLIEDHLKHLRVHRHLTRRGYRLVKRTGCNNWYVPRNEPFRLTPPSERRALWRRLWFHTPLAVVREQGRTLRRRLRR